MTPETIFLAAALIAYFGIPFLAIWTDDPDALATRSIFILWALFYLAPWIGFGLGIRFYPDLKIEFAIGASLWLLIASWPYYRAVARRAHDADFSPAYPYFAIIPPYNVWALLELVYAKSVKPENATIPTLETPSPKTQKEDEKTVSGL